LPDTHALVVRALSRVAEGDIAGGLAAWRAAVEGEVAQHVALQAQPLFSSVEGRDMRGDVPPPPSPAEPASPAWALAWAGDLGAARRLAEAQADGPEAWGLLGVLDVLERRSASGLALLDRAIAVGGGDALQSHRARALLQLGRLTEADRALSRIIEGESLGQRVLKALVAVRRGLLLPTFVRWCRRVVASDYQYNGLFGTELPAIVGRAALDRGFESRAALANLLEGVLDRMAGNLGESPTFADIAPTGRRFVRIEAPLPPRARAMEALQALRHMGPARTEASLTELLVRRPHSVHAHTHRGELYLWLGRYDEAWRDFVAARRIEPIRWADIGMVAVLTLTGRLRRARLAALYAHHHFPSIPGGTLPVYRGVLRRRIGDVEGAIVDLRAALAVKPTRLGARMELCLALRGAGLVEPASEHAALLLRDAAPLLVDAADAIGLDWRTEPARLTRSEVLDEALRAMRGNRSSGLVTWIDRTRTLRVLTPLAELRTRAVQVLAGLGVSPIRGG
jgi:tetratricopeptide (TPR) repeat protein